MRKPGLFSAPRLAGLVVLATAIVPVSAGCSRGAPAGGGISNSINTKEYPMRKSDQEWRQILDAESYRILREKGTERPFSGPLNKNYAAGEYLCRGCGQRLFESDSKYDSGSGWPSFFRPSTPGAVGEIDDGSHGMIRTEIVCSNCGGHLGHVFPDGPRPTGLRYCVNSAALDFRASEQKQ